MHDPAIGNHLWLGAKRPLGVGTRAIHSRGEGGWDSPPDNTEEHVTVLISAHPNDRLQVRIMRPGLYGVFRLSR